MIFREDAIKFLLTLTIRVPAFRELSATSKLICMEMEKLKWVAVDSVDNLVAITDTGNSVIEALIFTLNEYKERTPK